MIDRLLNGCAALISRRVLEDPGLREHLRGLDGKVVEARLLGPDLHLYGVLGEDGIRLTRVWDGPGDVSLRGTPLAILRLLQRSRQGDFGIGEGVDVQGDLAVLQRLQRLAGEFEVDLEDLLADWLGDTAAYGLSRGAATAVSIIGVTARTLEQNLREYVLFERRTVPANEEITAFVDAVDELRSGVDRLEQRVARLKRGLADA